MGKSHFTLQNTYVFAIRKLVKTQTLKTLAVKAQEEMRRKSRNVAPWQTVAGHAAVCLRAGRERASQLQARAGGISEPQTEVQQRRYSHFLFAADSKMLEEKLIDTRNRKQDEPSLQAPSPTPRFGEFSLSRSQDAEMRR